MDSTEPVLPGVATRVSDVRHVSLADLAQDQSGLDRVVPAPDGVKIPTATFDASL